MTHFIFNLSHGGPEQARALLDAKRWPVGGDERHRDALAPGDRALVFVALTREFVGRAEVTTAFLDALPPDPAASGSAMSGVLLGDIEHWTSGVPLDVAVQRIDPDGSNPYVQANASGFRAGVVQITPNEFAIVVSLHGSGRPGRRPLEPKT